MIIKHRPSEQALVQPDHVPAQPHHHQLTVHPKTHPFPSPFKFALDDLSAAQPTLSVSAPIQASNLQRALALGPLSANCVTPR